MHVGPANGAKIEIAMNSAGINCFTGCFTGRPIFCIVLVQDGAFLLQTSEIRSNNSA